jgi:Fibronectin type III domain
LTASAVSASEIDLTWTDNATNATGVKVERSPDDVTFTQVALLGATATSYNDTGLAASTTYSYRVKATNATGDSLDSNTASATTNAATTAPAAPSNLTATAVSASQINLAWTDNSNNETGFTIERSTDGTNFSPVITVGANVTSYSDTGLAASTKYYYRVDATNAGDDSPDSNTASVSVGAQNQPPMGA